ncbi:MAG: cation:proton antiporter [Bacteroidota bacterium]
MMLLSLGLLVITAYLVGWIFERIGLPKIIGYMLTGIGFSPSLLNLLSPEQLARADPILSLSLAFIVFEVGGELKWTNLKKEEAKIISITLLESLIPFFLISGGFFLIDWLWSGFLPMAQPTAILAFTLLLASMASPTDPTTTLAVIHQYKAKGKVKDTILSVAAIDDAMGILLFSLSTSIAMLLLGSGTSLWLSVGNALLEIGGGIIVGLVMAFIMHQLIHLLGISSEGQLIVLLVSLIALCYGIASYLKVDTLLSCMAMGLVLANTKNGHSFIFKTIQRYTEELIFVLFFVFSGLHLDIQSIPTASMPILIFILLRSIGKFTGSNIGARISHADPKVRRYTFGGLIPQGGIVIGLALIISQKPIFTDQFDLILSIIMGATLIHELIGPLTARYALRQAGEIQ